ncbi:hydroxylamine reductase [Acididesulfobacillus acetoxydans]|uniref:Hydroxylamine reductase n=1 Tax=Acididesulfobacillus acetoxydans TaxID=1561005 RepID=A0A8S0W699_9FIRM|nr:hydroxylamine reductase [Acididesulfobacillus acetoxydans]CAA7599649.1 hydroxylamine reductase [Acididesulfobacillus acetoxydans]CEJ06201.1 Hydroxylamine reductase [Acididesulfobacillus acetoxydans]
MSMFCFQCQETAKGSGCTIKGVCGKTDDVANLQDLLIYVLKGISIYANQAGGLGVVRPDVNKFVMESLFATITNANFDKQVFIDRVREGLKIREGLKEDIVKAGGRIPENPHDSAVWYADTAAEFEVKAAQVGVLTTANEDVRSLRELLIYGLKGMAAYAEHALTLGYNDDGIFRFMLKALAATTDDSLSADDLVALVLEAGKYGVDVMALLDKANTTTYGNPELTKVEIGVRSNPGILISGHDLKDLEELLQQTEGSGVDVYTHGEMLPAHYYPAFKKYAHFAGNYGNAWWKQDKEFASFNGPILLTTNCLTPPKDSYKDRLYTTGVVGFAGVKHIADRKEGQPKDFSAIIEQAKKCPPPTEIESGEIVGGFAHAQVLSLADKVVEAVKSGAIKRFFVMAGCDGRMKSREYYTHFAQALPADTVILTAGCAKYKYNKLNLGDIGGIPRVLDAGQCNDSYSLAVIALKLKEVFGLDDVNELPISYNIAWYEQKAVIVLLALLYLGVKKIHLGPTLPAFLSPNVLKVLVEKFDIGGISSVEDDLKMFMTV